MLTLCPFKGHIFYSASAKPEVDATFAVPMQPGDALIFDGNLLHYTPPNTTQTRRRALQLHYASATCQPTACKMSEKPKTTPTADTNSSGAGAESSAGAGAGAGAAKSTGGDESGLKQIIAAPNKVFGPIPTAAAGRGGEARGKAVPFDCAPPDGICIEPQYWYYRQAEIVASGERKDGCI